MSQPDQPRSLLPVSLAVLGLAVVIFLAMLVNYLQALPDTPGVTITPSTQTLTPSPSATLPSTATITLTPRPTYTLRPTETATITPTPSATGTETRLPTLTPAKPYKFNERYSLKNWELAEAGDLIQLMRDYAASPVKKYLPPDFDVWSYAAGYAQEEALLRFPESFEASGWLWGLANSQARRGQIQAVTNYSKLIETAVASGSVRVEDLPAWFSQYEQELDLEVYPLPTRPGQLSNNLIKLSGAGSAFIWLVELPGSVAAIPLTRDIDFTEGLDYDFALGDPTGSGSPSVVIYPKAQKAGVYELGLPRAFDLSQEPPVELPFAEGLPVDFGMKYETDLAIVENDQGGEDIQLTATFFPACPVHVTRTYRWNGDRFEYYPDQYQITPYPDLLAFCEVIVDHVALVWGPEAALTLAEPLLSLWPPAEDAQGKAYPSDALDAWRYRVGIYHALAGHQEEARQIFAEIVAQPVSSDSTWILPASQFLENYQSQEDLYQACREAMFCNMKDALRGLAEYGALPDPSQSLQYLKDHGMMTRSSGVFDFDLDGIEERWLTVQHRPGEKLELWILSTAPQGVKALYVQPIEDNSPQPYHHEPIGEIPITQLELGKGFVLARHPETGEPYLYPVDVEYDRPTYIRDELFASIQALMSGGDPAVILDQLLALQADPRFLGDCRAYFICDVFYYTLGLVYELVGSEREAVDTYIKLWWEHSQSPFAAMARIKLLFRPPPPTATATATPTRTPTNTPDPNASPTPTPTITNTPDPNATPTETNTPDPNATPTETPTETESPTQTLTPTLTETVSP